MKYVHNILGDVMKGKIIIILKTAMSSVLCFTMFISIGYLYLNSTAKTPAETKEEEIPYYQIPEEKGIMLDIGESRILFHLGFGEKILSVVYADEMDGDVIYGYSVDYVMKTDYTALEGIVDAIGGIDLEVGGEVLNYTGTQIIELLNTTVDKSILRRDITERVIYGISEKGMTVDDFLLLIENSETDLTVSDCYFWAEHMAELCKNVRFVN